MWLFKARVQRAVIMAWKRTTLGCVLLLALCAGWGNAGEWAAVRRVADGDTIELSDRRLVRYLGIDAPEIDHEAGTAQPFGFEARARNRERVGSRRVRLEYDAERFDVYGRTLAYVFLPDGAMLNEALLVEGLAFCLTGPALPRSGRIPPCRCRGRRSSSADPGRTV
jgi:micrococcal nuclease